MLELKNVEGKDCSNPGDCANKHGQSRTYVTIVHKVNVSTFYPSDTE
jgi:hypothetical protein